LEGDDMFSEAEFAQRIGISRETVRAKSNIIPKCERDD
jgi:DNA-binding CsgD family transcriptional regulator